MINNNNRYILTFILLFILLLLFTYNYNKEYLTTLPMSLILNKYNDNDKSKSWLPDKQFLDSNSANNVLTFTNNKKCDGKYIWNNSDEPDEPNKIISWDENKDCKLNPKYLHSMCLQRRNYNKKSLCSSLNGIVQYPQDADHPKNFEEF